jgi:UDP:flavonoid glycosyltransferase YjiC (YdhE family)
MSNILFTWEMGGNWGHIAKQLIITRALRQRGHRCLFAARDVLTATFQMAGERFDILQAPFYSTPEGESRLLFSYADILSVNGFDAQEPLSQLVKEWHAIFDKVAPDAVVADFAPTALLAAKLKGIPVLRVDTGFGLPPNEAPYPSFRPWHHVSREDLLAREQRLLGHINQICVKRMFPAFSSLQEAFRTGGDLLLTFPELDHYTGRRNGKYVGPIFNLDEGADMEWPDGSVTCIFVYLRPFEGLKTILRTLSSSGCNVIASIPGIGDDLLTTFSSPSFRISRSPVRLTHLLAKTDIVITHGGHGLASACLLAGVPMLLLPQVAEQLMTVYNFERLGIGKGVRCDEVAVKFAPALRRMLKDSSYRENAGRLSLKYAGYDQTDVVRKICMAIEENACGV